MTGITHTTALWYASRATGVVTMLLLTAVLVLGILVNRQGRLPGLPAFAVTGLHRNVSLLAGRRGRAGLAAVARGPRGSPGRPRRRHPQPHVRPEGQPLMGHPLSTTGSVVPQPPGRTPHSASLARLRHDAPRAPLRCPGG